MRRVGPPRANAIKVTAGDDGETTKAFTDFAVDGISKL